CKQQIKGKVYDQTTQQAIVSADMVLYDSNYNIIEEFQSDSLGEYLTKDLLCNYKYRIKASKQEYHTNEVSVVLGKEFDSYKHLDIALEPIEQKIEKEDDLFEKLKLDPIYFDFDKSNIRPDAAVELAKIVEVLKMYPQLKIDVRSHTDSRGDDNYNLLLSDKRAKSTINWMVNQGIDASRITGKGYGETQLVNQCANNIPCSKEMHQENRRSEFIILDI
ncbi:OmpA family protein, partial [Myroides injenensis]|uniref:OmpA family protein n=1 Tax=Myroides injenensis TaxID=1183151 RepID=UPI002271F1A7